MIGHVIKVDEYGKTPEYDFVTVLLPDGDIQNAYRFSVQEITMDAALVTLALAWINRALDNSSLGSENWNEWDRAYMRSQSHSN